MADTLIPAGVVAARAACSTLTDAQRVAFAIELVRDVADEHCVLQLNCMATMVTEAAHQLAKARFERRCA